jgi:hypothetical protein
MKQFKPQEGDKGRAIHPDLGKVVDVIYQQRWVHIASEGVDVFTLVGVHSDTDKVLVFPPSSTPDIAAAIKAKITHPVSSDASATAHPI